MAIMAAARSPAPASCLREQASEKRAENHSLCSFFTGPFAFTFVNGLVLGFGSKNDGVCRLIGIHWSLYLELLGEVVGDDGGEGREEGGQEDAHVADVNRDVEKVEDMIQGCRCDHQPLRKKIRNVAKLIQDQKRHRRQCLAYTYK